MVGQPALGDSTDPLMGLRKRQISDPRGLDFMEVGVRSPAVLLEPRAILLLKPVYLSGQRDHYVLPGAADADSSHGQASRVLSVGLRQSENPIGVRRQLDLSLGRQKPRQLSDHRVVLRSLG